MNLKALGIVVLLIIVSAFTYMYQSNKSSAEQAEQQRIAYENQKKQEQQQLVQQQAQATKKIEIDVKIKELQGKYMMDYAAAKAIVESPKMDQKTREFYTSISGRWSDAVKLAGSTSRIALAEPVANLQKLANELDQKQTETHCEREMKKELNLAYGLMVDGFLEFMRKSEVASSLSTELSSKYQKNATILFEYCTSI